MKFTPKQIADVLFQKPDRLTAKFAAELRRRSPLDRLCVIFNYTLSSGDVSPDPERSQAQTLRELIFLGFSAPRAMALCVHTSNVVCSHFFTAVQMQVEQHNERGADSGIQRCVQKNLLTAELGCHNTITIAAGFAEPVLAKADIEQTAYDEILAALEAAVKKNERFLLTAIDSDELGIDP